MQTDARLATDYISTNFGVDSSSHFPHTALTDRQTDKLTKATDHPAHAVWVSEQQRSTSPPQSHLGTARCYPHVGQCSFPLHVLAVPCATL